MDKLVYADDSGTFTFKASAPLEDVRKAILRSAFPEVESMQCYLVSTNENNDFVVAQNGSEYKVLVASCNISYEDMSATRFVEYKFAEEEVYHLARVSTDALEHYRSVKFKLWLDMLDNPTCEAQFRRMLQLGVVTRLYDKELFPTPEEWIEKYRVKDEHSGKMISIPHMVEELRIWNSATQQYDPIDSHLDGAPTEEERIQWWKDKIEEMKTAKGEEYIDSMLPKQQTAE